MFSCVGADSRISFNKDGSGTVKIEYRLSGELENLGKLDGNDNAPPLPAGGKDLERTAARIEGLRLLSQSSIMEGKDRILRARLAFSSPRALERFFDASGQYFRADFSGRRVSLVFPAAVEMSPEFKELAAGALEGYEFFLAFSMPQPVRVNWTGENGEAAGQVPGTCSVKGSTVEYRTSMADILFLDSGIRLDIEW
jgi:hypothetical protein